MTKETKVRLAFWGTLTGLALYYHNLGMAVLFGFFFFFSCILPFWLDKE